MYTKSTEFIKSSIVQISFTVNQLKNGKKEARQKLFSRGGGGRDTPMPMPA